MSKHLRPSEIVLADYWVVIDSDDRIPFGTLAQGVDYLERSTEGVTLWHIVPSEGTTRDMTADLAQQWFDGAEVYDSCPEAYLPYVGDEHDARRDRHEERGVRVSEHSTHYRGVGI